MSRHREVEREQRRRGVGISGLKEAFIRWCHISRVCVHRHAHANTHTYTCTPYLNLHMWAYVYVFGLSSRAI